MAKGVRRANGSRTNAGMNSTRASISRAAQAGARVNNGLRDAWQRHGYSVGEFRRNGGLYYRGGTTRGTQVRFHPNMPVQNPNSVWTFDGTLPPKLLMVRYGEPILMRHYNALPIDPAANSGFGVHTITHPRAQRPLPGGERRLRQRFFFPGQFYDYRWPMQLAGYDTINTGATDPRAGAAPNGNGGITRDPRRLARDDEHPLVPRPHARFHGAERLQGQRRDDELLQRPGPRQRRLQCNSRRDTSTSACPAARRCDWGNRDYDVNLVVADKAWDANGQLWFNIFNTDGFLGDQVLVNWQYQSVPRRARAPLSLPHPERLGVALLQDRAGHADRRSACRST